MVMICHNGRDLGSILGSGRFPGEGNCKPLQFSCLRNPMDRGVWWAIDHGMPKSWNAFQNTVLWQFSSNAWIWRTHIQSIILPGPGALGRPRGIGWIGRWERGSGWGPYVNPWLIHFNVWQNPLQYCKIISFQLKKKKKSTFRLDWGQGSMVIFWSFSVSLGFPLQAQSE